VFVLDELPLASTNKVDRKKLGEWARAGMAPAPDRQEKAR
jgi:acyl-CoA synthetase (AMP-forming)/AMP-acid ligase II